MYIQFTSYIRAVALIVLLSHGAAAPCGQFELIDSEIFLVGDFEDLDSIQITSTKGLLSLGNIATFALTEPFHSRAAVLTNKPEHVVYGVLGPKERISIEGETRTSILYSSSLDVAKGGNGIDGDLSFGLSIGGSRLFNVTAEDFFRSGITIIDGAITFVGSIDGLSGIEARSKGGFLSLETVSLPGSTLFPTILASTVTTNEPAEIEIAARNANNRVSFDGSTASGIFYSGESDELAFGDLTLSVGLGDAAPIALPFVPEPSSVLLGYVGLFGLLCLRIRRITPGKTGMH